MVLSKVRYKIGRPRKKLVLFRKLLEDQLYFEPIQREAQAQICYVVHEIKGYASGKLGTISSFISNLVHITFLKFWHGNIDKYRKLVLQSEIVITKGDRK